MAASWSVWVSRGDEGRLAHAAAGKGWVGKDDSEWTEGGSSTLLQSHLKRKEKKERKKKFVGGEELSGKGGKRSPNK